MYAPDINSKKKLLSSKELAEVEEYEDLRYKKSALQGREQGYKPYKLTKKQLGRLVDLHKKYIHIFYTQI